MDHHQHRETVKIAKRDLFEAMKQKNDIDMLRGALQSLVDNVLDYEKVNNLSPNPGRKYCWDSVAHAVSVLEQTK